MDQVLESSFDFSIRAIELMKYLEEEQNPFPLYERFLTCAVGIGVCLRLGQVYGKKSVEENRQALYYATEAEYFLKLMAKTGYLHEKQSHPLIGDCQYIQMLLEGILKEN